MLKARKLTPAPGDPAILPAVYSGDQVLFAAKLGDSTNIWEVAIPPNRGRVNGEPRRRTSGTNNEVQPAVSAGSAVFASLTLTTGIWSSPNWTGRETAGLAGEMNRVTHGVTMDGYPSLAADGRRMVFISGRSGRPNVWLRDMRSGKESQLTGGERIGIAAEDQCDGSTIAYVEDQPRPRKRKWSGPRPEAGSVRPSGSVMMRNSDRRFARWLAAAIGRWRGAFPGADGLANRQAAPVDRSARPLAHLFGAISNDGNWISFHSDLGRSGVRQISVVRLKPGLATIPQAEWINITDGKSMDREAVWGPGDNMLYFLSEREGFRCIWAQPLDPSTKQPRGAPFAVAHFHRISRSLGSMPGTVAAIGLSGAARPTGVRARRGNGQHLGAAGRGALGHA